MAPTGKPSASAGGSCGPSRWQLPPPREGGERAVWLDLPSLLWTLCAGLCGTRSPGEGSPTAGRSLTSEKAWVHFKPHLGVKLLVRSGKGSPLWHYGMDYVLY